jgi:FMN phosphatase YigB (HAD superfamily)
VLVRNPHLVELIAALKRQGKIIGIFSDYPATDKLAAMGLLADHVVAAAIGA